MRKHDTSSLAGIRRSCSIDPVAGCWHWKGATSDGYGQVTDPSTRKLIYVHRLTFILAGGHIPASYQLDHICRVRACCNPEHLRVVTGRENILCSTGFSARNAKKTACPKGHPYSGHNLYIRPSGYRECRACARERARIIREADRAAYNAKQRVWQTAKRRARREAA